MPSAPSLPPTGQPEAPSGSTGDESLLVAYTLEACWHRVPGGTALAAIEICRHLATDPTLRLIGVAAKHRSEPAGPYRPPVVVRQLGLPRPLLYESWVRFGRPPVERVTGAVALTHSTALVPAATSAPNVVTIHDVAFLRSPDQFPRRGRRLMERSLAVARQRAAMVITSSNASRDDLAEHGFDLDRIRVVPLGVDDRPAPAGAVARVRARYGLPDEFVLFVGTMEPRKNLRRLALAAARTDSSLPLVIAGADGWGDVDVQLASVAADGTRFIGFVPPRDLGALYAAATVFAYPSEREGFGLPVLEAMAQGTPVVTSRGTSTEEVAGGAAELVDPFDVDAIATGLDRAVGRAHELASAGRRRAAQYSWDVAAARTRDVYREVVGR